jgi:hypothetical protein
MRCPPTHRHFSNWVIVALRFIKQLSLVKQLTLDKIKFIIQKEKIVVDPEKHLNG